LVFYYFVTEYLIILTTLVELHAGNIAAMVKEEKMFKEIVLRTHVRTEDGRRTMGIHKSSPSAHGAQVS